jgi:NAD(P)-dependent dehydrogenase (short-subunit alcohol dehydrogenase family)
LKRAVVALSRSPSALYASRRKAGGRIMTQIFDLTGKRALITGGSRGLGLACAAALRSVGAEVVLVARKAADLDRAVAALGSGAQALVCDITDTAAMRKALEALPPFHVLVNNAGINIPEPFTKTSEANYDAIFNLNLRATFFISQTVANKMIDAGIRGSIVNMSSQTGHRAAPGRPVYIASKHGLEGLNKAMAIDLAPHGIRVNAIAPTFIETDLTRYLLDKPGFRESMTKRIPIGRLGQPEDIAGAVIYLASEASGLVTGICINVDGGLTAQG